MSYSENPYQSPSAYGTIVRKRAGTGGTWLNSSLRKTYLHLAGAVLAFVGLEALLLNSPFGPQIVNMMMGARYSWLIVMVAFVGVSYLAQSWAMSTTSLSTQYMGLGLYVLAEAIIFLPILLIAQQTQPDAIPAAGLVTAVLFGGLTAIVFITRQDFSFLRGALMLGGLVGLLFIVWAVCTNHDLGIAFSIGIIGLACGYILYDTSNVMLRYRTNQHVAASLALFASVALLFWYVLRLLMQMNRR